jgi:hypothetical protein
MRAFATSVVVWIAQRLKLPLRIVNEHWDGAKVPKEPDDEEL